MKKETVTREYIANLIHNKLGFSKTESSIIVDKIVDELVQVFVEGNNLKLSSIGKFIIRSKRERLGRNPKTKIEAKITARRVISFNSSRVFKQQINDLLRK